MDKKFLATIGGIGFIAILLLFGSKGNTPLGSVQRANEYFATTTDSSLSSWKLIKSGTGVLGSVVVSLTSNAGLNLYDATTTVNGGVYGTTTLAAFNTTTAGTYTFDVNFQKGLVIETISAVGIASTTVTYR